MTSLDLCVCDNTGFDADNNWDRAVSDSICVTLNDIAQMILWDIIIYDVYKFRVR